MGLTIKDIAKRANVSTATVSRILNNSKPVSNELKQKVMAIIEETGYTPNALARGLIQNKTGLLGMILPQISNVNFSGLIEGFEEVARRYGYHIILANGNGNTKEELNILQIFKEKKLDGVLLSASENTEELKDVIQKQPIPMVIFGQEFEDLPSVPYVNIDNYSSAYEATRYLIDLGHKDIAMIRGPYNDPSAGEKRYKGFSDALREVRIEPREEWVVEGNFTIKAGYQGMLKILSNYQKPTAVFAASDLMAIGALKCLKENDYPVPEKMSVIGFDDIEMADVMGLTTIHQDPHDIGSVAARILIKQLRGETVRENKVILPHRLVVRTSTEALI